MIEAPEPHATARLDSLAFHRFVLEREREDLRKSGTWKERAVMAGWVGYLLSLPLERGIAWTWPLVGIAAGLVYLGVSWWSNRRKVPPGQRHVGGITY